jgi:hypothetical protein
VTGPIEVTPSPTPVVMCSYAQYCPNVAVAHVWEQTRPGLILEDDACPRHLRSALALGYHQGYPPKAGDPLPPLRPPPVES